MLTAAVEQGINPDSTYYVSAPFTYKIHPAGNCEDGTWWCVKTYANDYYGWSSIRSATLRSDNTVYAQLTLDVGPEKVADAARRMGVRSQLDVNGAYVPAIGLGSIAVSPLDLASRTPRSQPAASMPSRWRFAGSCSRMELSTRKPAGAGRDDIARSRREQRLS